MAKSLPWDKRGRSSFQLLQVYKNLHGWKSPKEFAEHLKDATSKDYGFAGPAFVLLAEL
jgi:hypothetical protein